MGKKQTCPAIHLKKKIANRHKATSCIPTVELPKGYTPNGNNSNWDGTKEYRKMVPEPSYKSISTRSRIKKGKPWYYFGQKEHITHAYLTHNELIEGYLKHKLKKWAKTHPEPIKTDLFYAEQHPIWEADYEAQHDKIMSALTKKIKKYNKPLVYAILDSRAEHKIAA